VINTLKVDLNRKELIKAIKAMKKKERDSFLEDLLAIFFYVSGEHQRSKG
jgi:hypothetical protein